MQVFLFLDDHIEISYIVFSFSVEFRYSFNFGLFGRSGYLCFAWLLRKFIFCLVAEKTHFNTKLLHSSCFFFPLFLLNKHDASIFGF